MSPARSHGLLALAAALVGFAAGRASAPPATGPGESAAPVLQDGTPPAGASFAPPTAASSAATTAPPAAPSASVGGRAALPADDVAALPADDVAALPADDVAARAREGNLAALKALESREVGARSIDEALALEAGHAALARREAQRLVDDVTADRSLLDDPGTLTHAYRLVLDPTVAPTLLAGLAANDHPVVADFLFDLAERGEPGGRLVLLAEDLLQGVARPRASPALAITLLVRAARSCERVAALLPRIAESADDRVLPLLERLDVRTGCGPKGRDDCHGCLRDPERAAALESAREAARGRRFVAPWARPGR